MLKDRKSKRIVIKSGRVVLVEEDRKREMYEGNIGWHFGLGLHLSTTVKFRN